MEKQGWRIYLFISRCHFRLVLVCRLLSLCNFSERRGRQGVGHKLMYLPQVTHTSFYCRSSEFTNWEPLIRRYA